MTPVAHSETVEILPLEAAQFPRNCYVVTDRLSELIARPMQDFQDLGEIPDEEISQKTLPIFDNHRVAKRFIRGAPKKSSKFPMATFSSKRAVVSQPKALPAYCSMARFTNSVRISDYVSRPQIRGK